MSVLINEMEMPTNADMAPTAVWVYPNGYAIVFKDNGRMQQYTQAVPVPPHGRMIDADWFAAEMKKRQEEAGKWLREAKDRETAVRADAVLSFLCEVKLTLDAAPIIITEDDKGINVPNKEEGE